MPVPPAAPSIRALRILAFLVALLAAPAALAQIVEAIDVVRRGEQAVIQVRFATTVRYLRHAPPDRGKLVQIEFEVTGPLDGSLRRIRQVRRHPATEINPAFLLTLAPETSGLTIEFREEVAFQVGGGNDGRSIEVRLPVRGNGRPPAVTTNGTRKPTPVPAPKAPTPSPQKPVPDSRPPGPAAAAPDSVEVEAQASRALGTAKAAIANNDLAAAIESLNRVLDLPPTRSSQEAQELIGGAREQNGEFAKARVEYELYLKVYPDGAGAERVKVRLAALATRPATEPRAKRPATPEFSTYGSVSSYYYSGNSKFDSTLQPVQPSLPADQISLTSKDQSALITNIDLTSRYRSGAWDQRINLRDTYTANFLSGEANDNRLNALYYEVVNREYDLLSRVGRQSSPGVGVLGRFDGAWGRIAFAPGWRVGAVAGRPVEFFDAPDKRLAGASLDVGPFLTSWSGNVFAIEQRVDGISDRRAVGAEVRFLDPVANGFGLVDYDTAQRVLNTILVQANWNLTPEASANLLFDRRRTPTLQLTNALVAYPGLPTVQSLIDSGIARDQLRRDAKAVTPISDLYAVGLTYRLTPRWQLGGDVKLQKVSATQAAGALPASPGTGNIWIYTAQGIGTSLWTTTDVFVASASVIRGALFDGWTISGSYVVVLWQDWRLEGQLKYYRQNDASGTKLDRITPTAKLSYRLKENFTLEAEAGIERSDSRGPMQSDLADRRFYNLGIRWDFY